MAGGENMLDQLREKANQLPMVPGDCRSEERRGGAGGGWAGCRGGRGCRSSGAVRADGAVCTSLSVIFTCALFRLSAQGRDH